MEGTASSNSITTGREEGEAAATPTPTFNRCKKNGRSPREELSHFRQSEVWSSHGHLADDEVVSSGLGILYVRG